MQSCTLYELHEFIQRVLALNFPEAWWVSCEIAQLNQNRGHWYFSLVQKAEDSDEIVAQAEAVLWERQYRLLRRQWGANLDALLQEGVEVRLRVQVNFHERYGLKLMVEDIDPAYTLGRLEMLRRQTIARLETLQLLERNRRLPLPSVLQRIAVLSSETAAGWQDYQRQLEENPYGYRFFNTLFPSSMQGRLVEPEMLAQLQRIGRLSGQFDCVVIIRGGGARLDLSAFDGFDLARRVAEFPLPVLTGIGHEIDQTVVDLVAHTALRTPTAVADFLLSRNLQFEGAVQETAYRILLDAQGLLRRQEAAVDQLESWLQMPVQRQLSEQGRLIGRLDEELQRLAPRSLRDQERLLDQMEKMIRLVSPEATLRRGYALIRKGGQFLQQRSQLQPGERFSIDFSDGSVPAQVLPEESE